MIKVVLNTFMAMFFVVGILPPRVCADNQNCLEENLNCDQLDKEIEVITVSSHGLLERLGDTGNFSRFHAHEIDFIRHMHINELMSRASNAWISRGSGQEHLTAMRSPVLTGSGACGSFLYLNDGVPIRPLGFCNINNLFEINTEQAERIELIKGPSGAIYGGNALNGSINVVNQRADKLDDHLMVELGGNQFRRFMFSSQAMNNETHGLSIQANISDSGSFRLHEHYRQQKFTSVYDYQGDEWLLDFSFSATNLNQKTAGFVRGFEAYKDDELRTRNTNPDAFRDAWSLRFVSKFKRTLLSDHAVQVIPYWRESKMEFLQHFLPGTPHENNGQVSRGVISNYKMPWVEIGVQLEVADGFLREYQNDSIETSAFLQETRPVGMHYDYHVNSKAKAVYLNIDKAISTQLIVLLSFRYEVLDYQYINHMLDGNTREDGSACGFGGCLFTRPGDRNDRYNNTAARIGFDYTLNRLGRFFVNHSQGFRAPQATELYRLQSGQSVADLESVLLDGFEMGFRGVIGPQDDLLYEVLAFRQRKNNIIFRDANGNQIDDGKTKSAGWEFALKYNLSARQQLAFNGSYARYIYDFNSEASSEMIVQGNDVDTAPRTMMNFRWVYSGPREFRLEVEGMYQGKYYINAENSAFFNGRDVSTYPGHTLLNIRARYGLSKNWILSGSIRNLLNSYYAERADYTQFGPPGESNRFRYFPGALRTFYVGMRYAY